VRRIVSSRDLGGAGRPRARRPRGAARAGAV